MDGIEWRDIGININGRRGILFFNHGEYDLLLKVAKKKYNMCLCERICEIWVWEKDDQKSPFLDFSVGGGPQG